MNHLFALSIFFLSQLCFVQHIHAFDQVLDKSIEQTNKLGLSNQEREWIKNNRTVNVAVKSGWMPIEFRLENESNRGVAIDYLNEISKLTGLKFNLVQNSGNYIDPKKIQLVSGITGKLVPKDFTKTEQPYLVIPYAIYINHSKKNEYQNASIEDLINAKVAIYKGGPLSQKITKDYAKIDLVSVDIADEAFEYLDRNQIDAYIGNELVIDYHIEFHRIKFAKKSTVTPYTSDVSMAVRNDEVLLLSIINKALGHIGKNNPDILDYWKTPVKSVNPFSIVLVIVLLAILFAVSYWLFSERANAKQEYIKNQKRIWHQANYDLQTTLPNRNLYETKIDQIINLANKKNTQFAFMFIDLDDFKNVNDVSGHSIGDLLLKEVGVRLGMCIREEDFVARLGGDEFVVIINNVENFSMVDGISKKILTYLRLPYHINQLDFFITATIGISKYPQDSINAEELLSYADQAMYEAKKLGRNQYLYFTKSMQDRLNNKIYLANELRYAIDADQFEMVYQPILDLKTLQCAKVEALIRWHHPKNGLIRPDEFILIAEETGMIHQLGIWILNQVIKDILTFREQLNGTKEPPMFCINISPKQFSQPQHLDDFILSLKSKKISPSIICLEITEGLLLDASQSVFQTIKRLKAEGVKFAIDDFGTGYSALAYLKKFDIDYVKIDKSFVRNIDGNSSNRVLCESIIMMSHRLNIKLIAEGVELQVQEDILKHNECDYIQGYLHGKPMPLNELINRELTVKS